MRVRQGLITLHSPTNSLTLEIRERRRHSVVAISGIKCEAIGFEASGPSKSECLI
jgi:hypothetical protein